MAAAISGRRYLGIELEQNYHRVARARLARAYSASSAPADAGRARPGIVPDDVDGFIGWLREHRLEGVARVVESAKEEYGW